MMSKLKILLPVLLLVGGGAYKFVLAKPKVKEPVPKVHGEVYVLPKDFLVNLSDGRFGKLNVALVFDHGFTAAPAAGGHGAATEAPEGYGVLNQEPLVRAIVTDVLTDSTADDLTGAEHRNEIEEKIAKRIKKTTDVKVHEVLFTDVAVQ
jgi:flagellar basal body-associated protein FliL